MCGGNYCAAVAFGEEAINPAGETASQIVGYKSYTCKADMWYMIGVDFQTIGNSAAQKTCKLQDFIKGDYVGTTDELTAPMIQIWDPTLGSGGDYVTYYFYSQTSGSATGRQFNFWSSTGRTKDAATAAQSVNIDIGKGAWFRCKQDCSITVAGQVVPVSASTIDVKAGLWNLVANPFPVALKINKNVNWLELVEASKIAGTTDELTAPIIQTWDPTLGSGGDYVTYYFYSQTSGSATGRQFNFWSSTGRTKDAATAAQDAAIPVGNGFWLKYTGQDMTLNFTR